MGGWQPGPFRRPDLGRAPRIALQGGAVALVALGAWILAHHLPRSFGHRSLALQVSRGAVQWGAGGEALSPFGETASAFPSPPFAALALAPLALGGWRLQAGL